MSSTNYVSSTKDDGRFYIYTMLQVVLGLRIQCIKSRAIILTRVYHIDLKSQSNKIGFDLESKLYSIYEHHQSNK